MSTRFHAPGPLLHAGGVTPDSTAIRAPRMDMHVEADLAARGRRCHARRFTLDQDGLRAGPPSLRHDPHLVTGTRSGRLTIDLVCGLTASPLPLLPRHCSQAAFSCSDAHPIFVVVVSCSRGPYVAQTTKRLSVSYSRHCAQHAVRYSTRLQRVSRRHRLRFSRTIVQGSPWVIT